MYSGPSYQSDNSKWWQRTIYLTNLPKEFTKTDLEELMRVHIGDVQTCQIFKKDSDSMGKGSLTFYKNQDATKAVEKMNSYDLVGYKINIFLDSTGELTNKTLELTKMHNEKKSELDKTPVSNSRKNHNNKRKLASLNSTEKPVNNMLEPEHKLQRINKRKSPKKFAESFQSPSKRQKNSPNNILNLTPLMNLKTVKIEKDSEINTSGKIPRQVFVHNIDFNVSERKIKQVFSQDGLNPIRVHLYVKGRNLSMGIAEVKYKCESDALKAVSLLNDRLIGNRKIGVKLDFKSLLNESEESSETRLNLPAGLKTVGPKLSDRHFSDTESSNSLCRSNSAQSSLSSILRKSPERFQGNSGNLKENLKSKIFL